MKIGIIGLGLIGGSMAKSLKARTAHTVWGQDIDQDIISMAVLSKAIDGELPKENIDQCDLLLLALPPVALIQWVEDHGSLIGAKSIVVDLCGVKRQIAASLRPLATKYGFTYLGGHPMAGKEKGGFLNSSKDLFLGASMILTPDEQGDIFILERLQDFFEAIGFEQVQFSTYDEHDRIIAYTSQLAHIASSAYIKSPTAQMQKGFSAGSYKDLTRVANLDENMWTELFWADRDYLLEELELLCHNLNQYLLALQIGDKEALRLLLQEGRMLKESAGGY